MQSVGLPSSTYEITIQAESSAVKLVIPSTVPVTANSWATEEGTSSELTEVMATVVPSGSTYFIHDTGRVWQATAGVDGFTELEVPKFAETRLNARKITGQTLFWTGLATSSISLGLGMNYYIQGQNAYQSSADAEDWTNFVEHRAELNNLESQYNASLLTFVGGLGLMGLGYAVGF